MIAAKNMKAPNAPNAITAPRFNLAPSGSLRSPSTESGMFTLGASPRCIFELPAISLSWGWPAIIICGSWVVEVVNCGVDVLEVVLLVLLFIFKISMSARIVVGLGEWVLLLEVEGLVVFVTNLVDVVGWAVVPSSEKYWIYENFIQNSWNNVRC